MTTEARREIKRAQRDSLVCAFDTLWAQIEGQLLESEFRFNASGGRDWRLDRAHPAAMVGIEIDGGTWSNGRHVREPGYSNDCEKINTAQAQGWTVFRLTGPMLTENPHYHLTQIKLFIKRRL
jgi:very-short-patch-repair endonuclease